MYSIFRRLVKKNRVRLYPTDWVTQHVLIGLKPSQQLEGREMVLVRIGVEILIKNTTGAYTRLYQNWTYVLNDMRAVETPLAR